MRNGSRRRWVVPTVGAVVSMVVLAACGSDSSTESTSASTTVVAPAGASATTVVAGAQGTGRGATKALCAEIESAGNAVAEGRFVAGGLALSRAVDTHDEKADPTVVEPARRMLAAGLAGDLDAGAAAVSDAVSACRRLGYPLDLPTDPGPVSGGGKQCITTPCN